MSQDGCNGAVVVKNVQLQSNNFFAADGISTIKHGNGRDWWVLVRQLDPANNEYFWYLVSPSGVTLEHTQNIGDIVYANAIRIEPSNDGSKIAVLCNKGFTAVYDFNRCDGLLTNEQILEQDEFSIADMNNDGWVDLITSHELGFAIRFNNQGVGLNDAFSDNINYTIYPNPILDGIINVHYLLPQNTTAIFELFDITGKVVFKDELRGFESQESFILPNLNNGIYFAMVTAEGIRKISKVVILSKT